MDSLLGYLACIGAALAFLYAVYRVMLWIVPDDMMDVFGPEDEPKR